MKHFKHFHRALLRTILLFTLIFSYHLVYAAWNAPITVDDGGATDNVGFDTSLILINGNPAISYINFTTGDLKFVRATNAAGSAWAPPKIITNAGSVGRYTSLAIVNGNPAIAYYDGHLRFVRGSNAEGSAWDPPQTLDNSVPVGFEPSLAIVNGNPAISYYDQTNDNLKFVRASNTNGSAWDSPQTIDIGGTDDVGRLPSLAVVDGNPAIAYYDFTNGELNFLRSGDANGSIWGAPQILDDNGAGWDPSLVIVNGNPAIAYHDFINGGLKFIRASNADGSAWNTPQIVDSANDAGFFTSLAVVNGHPAIGYYDNTTLKFVRATDADGSAWGTLQTLDNAGTVGWAPSLAIVDGNPALSYHDATNGALKFIQAADPSAVTLNQFDTATTAQFPSYLIGLLLLIFTSLSVSAVRESVRTGRKSLKIKQ